MSSRAPVGYLADRGRAKTAVNQGFIAMVCDGPLPPSFRVLNWAFSDQMETIKACASGIDSP